MRQKEKLKRIPNLPENTFLKIMKVASLCGVECVIQASEGVLLTKRKNKPFKGYWHVPGSFVHYNEKLEDAVKRCARNELGAQVEIKKYDGYYDGIGVDPRGHFVGHIFICKLKGTAPKVGKRGEKIKFFRKLPKKLPSHHKKFLRKLGYI